VTGVVAVIGAGAMGSIGHAVALRAAHDGATVVVADVQRPAARVADVEAAAGWRGTASVVEQIERDGGTAVALACDITSGEQLDALVREAERHGPLTGLVNATRAPLEKSLPFTELDERVWQTTLDVNLTGALRCTQVAAAAMTAGGTRGSIVHLSSMASTIPQRGRTAYSVTKAALNTLVRIMSLDLAQQGIRVNAVLPGIIATHRVDPDEQARAKRLGVSVAEQRERLLEQQGRAIPLGRAGRPEEVAGTVAFLLGQDSSYITGELISVGGGVLAPLLTDESPGGAARAPEPAASG